MENITRKPRRRLPGAERRTVLGVTALALIIVYVLWNVPAFGFIVSPLRLFVTYVHEAGHSLAAIVTGGQVIGFTVAPNGSGLATTAGGSRFFILPMGYLGAALFGSLLFYAANRVHRRVRPITLGLGAFMIVFTVLFARPDEVSGQPLALFLGIGFGVILLGAGYYLNRTINLLLVNVLGVMTALNGLLDLIYLTQNSTQGAGFIRNDAAAFSKEIAPLLPPSLIALSWAAIAIGLFAAAVWFGLWRPLMRDINDAYRDRATAAATPKTPAAE